MKKLFVLLGALGLFCLAPIKASVGNFSPAYAEQEVISSEYVVEEDSTAIIPAEFDWKNIFTPENILLLLSTLLSAGFAGTLLKVLVKYKKTKTVDREEVIKAVKDALPEQTKNIVADIIEKNIVPMASKIIVATTDMEEAMSKFIQAFLFSLDGTMESKSKIISLLGDLKLSDETTVNALKTFVAEQVELIKKENAKNQEILRQFKEANSKALEDIIAITEKTPEEKVITSGKEKNGYDGTEI